jgi:hypothetical protein
MLCPTPEWCRVIHLRRRTQHSEKGEGDEISPDRARTAHCTQTIMAHRDVLGEDLDGGSVGECVGLRAEITVAGLSVGIRRRWNAIKRQTGIDVAIPCSRACSRRSHLVQIGRICTRAESELRWCDCCQDIASPSKLAEECKRHCGLAAYMKVGGVAPLARRALAAAAENEFGAPSVMTIMILARLSTGEAGWATRSACP